MAFAHARRAAITKNAAYSKQLRVKIFFNEAALTTAEEEGKLVDTLAIIRGLDRHNLPAHLRGVVPGQVSRDGIEKPPLAWIFRQKAAAVMATAARITSFLTVHEARAVGILHGLALGTAGVHALQAYFPSRRVILKGHESLTQEAKTAFKWDTLQIEERPDAAEVLEIWFAEPTEEWFRETPNWAPLPDFRGAVRTPIFLPSTAYQAVSDPHEGDQFPLSVQQRYALLSAVWAQEQVVGFAHLLDVADSRDELELAIVLNKADEDLLSHHQALRLKDCILQSINSEINQNPETGEFAPRVWLSDELVGFPNLAPRPASEAELTKLVKLRGKF